MIKGCCCTSVLKYCDIDICDGQLDLDTQAQLDGEYTLYTYFLDSAKTIKQTFVVNEQLIFDVSSLNENYEYTVELYDPAGDRIIIQKDYINYDCFKFKTVINKTVTIEPVES